jgi:peroxiredoxin
MTSSLQAELDAFKATWMAKTPAGTAKTMSDDIRALRQSGILERALKAGSVFPALTVLGPRGEPVLLAELYRKTPLIVTFYRGGWCPYCNIELQAYQKLLPQIKELGGALLAVSPETPDNSLSTAEKNGLEFEVLSDTEGKLADALGVRFELTPVLQELYHKFGHELPERIGDGRWSLPMPATYVVQRGGRIALAHIDPGGDGDVDRLCADTYARTPLNSLMIACAGEAIG